MVQPGRGDCMRLIDADALNEKLEALMHRYAKQGRKRVAEDYNFVMTVLMTGPTIDAVQVVRCKDCKHYYHYGRTSVLVDGTNKKAGWCNRRVRYDEEHRMLSDDFCSYGERRCEDE